MKRLPFCSCFGGILQTSVIVALPNAAIAAVFQYIWPDGSMSLFGEVGGLLTETIVWSGFNFLLGFLIVFRTSQSYARWWEGCSSCHFMRAEWFDAFVTLKTFAEHSNASQKDITYFKHMLVRLGSLLHATALAELEKGATGGEVDDGSFFYEYDIISPSDLDEDSWDCLRRSKTRVELVYGWILHHILDGVAKSVLTVPPPLLTRAYQELGSGLVHYHNAVKLAMSPFPFLYVRTCDGLLLIHWVIAPVVTSQWATHWVWAAFFAFIQVFVLSLLNSIAAALANPFGRDPNDVDGEAMQVDMNLLLTSLLAHGSERAPAMLGGWDHEANAENMDSRESLAQVLRPRSSATLADAPTAAAREITASDPPARDHRVPCAPAPSPGPGPSAPPPSPAAPGPSAPSRGPAREAAPRSVAEATPRGDVPPDRGPPPDSHAPPGPPDSPASAERPPPRGPPLHCSGGALSVDAEYPAPCGTSLSDPVIGV